MDNAIIIFGIGQLLEDLIDELKKKYKNMILSDNNSVYWNRKFYGVECVAPEALRNKDVYIAVSNNVNYEQIEKQLMNIGCRCFSVDKIIDINAAKLTYSTTTTIVETEQLQGDFQDKRGNQVIFSDDNLVRNCVISFSGKNNKVTLGKDLSIRSKTRIYCYGNDNVAEIGDNVKIGRVGFESDIALYKGSKCIIGEGTDIQQCTIVANEYGNVTIEHNCMFSYGVKVRQSDFHPIFDKKSGERINKKKDIIVESEVWIGEDAMLLAGAHIGKGSIVGAKAVTSSRFPPNTVVAGNPAKIIRENVIWSMEKV